MTGAARGPGRAAAVGEGTGGVPNAPPSPLVAPSGDWQTSDMWLALSLFVACSEYALKTPSEGSGAGDTAAGPGTDTADEGTDSSPDTDTDATPPEGHDSDSGDSGGPPDTSSPPDSGDPGPDPEDPDFCEKAASIAGFLDSYQVPGDGRVIYCHSGTGRHYTIIDTDISSCLPHLDHVADVFPSTLCDS